MVNISQISLRNLDIRSKPFLAASTTFLSSIAFLNWYKFESVASAISDKGPGLTGGTSYTLREVTALEKFGIEAIFTAFVLSVLIYLAVDHGLKLN